MPRRRVSLVVSISMVVCVTLGMTALGGSARAARPFSSGGGAPSGKPRSLLAAVPYMGWNTYYGVGGDLRRADDHLGGQVAAAPRPGPGRLPDRVARLRLGQRPARRPRRADRRPTPVAARPALADRLAAPPRSAGGDLHRRGYAAAVTAEGVGSLGHYQQDADALRRLGVRRRQGRLLRRRPGGTRAQAGLRAVRQGDARTTRATGRCS